MSAAAAGDAATTQRLAGQLARELLASPEVVLALRVTADGDHVISAGIDLAKLLIDGDVAERGSAEGEGQ